MNDNDEDALELVMIVLLSLVTICSFLFYVL